MTGLAERRGFDTNLYDPAEDSALLANVSADCIEAASVVLDVGTGSGFVADRIRDQAGANVIGIDVNPHACRRAAERGIPVVRGDLVSPFTANTFDVIVCNPPYLPTPLAERTEDWLSVALSGGPSGRDIVEALLVDAGRVLRPDGEMYLLTSSLMGIEEVYETAASHGFVVEEIGRDQSFPFEVLAVQHLTR